jgi:CheY-specific phosphatase CheX
MKLSNTQKDILNAFAFIIGIAGVFAGQYIISSALFAATTLASNINMNSKKNIG